MQILIIEDEARAARQLQQLLTSCSFQYELLEVIDTVVDAVEWFKTNATPDLVFMDIQLADGISFEIFGRVSVEAPIIFTTAFDQYAIQAFKVNSIDYLLKPIRQSDLNDALVKFEKSNRPAGINTEVLQQLMGSLRGFEKRNNILVKEGSGFAQISVSELSYIYSEDSITFGVSGAKRYIIDETMDQLYESLDTSDFFRINRGQIVAKKAIVKIDRYFNHRLKLSVNNTRDQEFIVSRQKTSSFKDWMNK
ncbi:MAG: LytR/AlgR family response regulator transcription factor [Flavobacteriaceae bacterium]